MDGESRGFGGGIGEADRQVNDLDDLGQELEQAVLRGLVVLGVAESLSADLLAREQPDQNRSGDLRHDLVIADIGFGLGGSQEPGSVMQSMALGFGLFSYSFLFSLFADCLYPTAYKTVEARSGLHLSGFLCW